MRYAAVQFTSGGRIGHRFKDQTTARIASRLHGLTYVHTPYPDHDVAWNDFLGFDEGEILLNEVRDRKFVVIRNTAWTGLPLDFVEKKISEHPEDETVFLFIESARIMLEQLPEKDYGPIIKTLRDKYFNKRETFPVINYFKKEKINVALHVRRGSDIDPKSGKCTAAWRYTDISYYAGILKNLRQLLRDRADFHVYSQGDEKDFDALKPYGVKLHLVKFPPKNHYALFQSFHHMCLADIFVTATSAFSYFVSWMNPNRIINLPVKEVVKLPQEDRVFLSEPDGSFEFERLVRSFQ